jgi:hypothetical protein
MEIIKLCSKGEGNKETKSKIKKETIGKNCEKLF